MFFSGLKPNPFSVWLKHFVKHIEGDTLVSIHMWRRKFKFIHSSIPPTKTKIITERERPGEGRIVVFVIEAIKICEAKTKSSYLDSVVVLLQWVWGKQSRQRTESGLTAWCRTLGKGCFAKCWFELIGLLELRQWIGLGRTSLDLCSLYATQNKRRWRVLEEEEKSENWVVGVRFDCTDSWV